MEIQIILFAVIFILLFLIAVLYQIIHTLIDQRDANKEEMRRITQENSRLINELVKFIKTESDGRD